MYRRSKTDDVMVYLPESPLQGGGFPISMLFTYWNKRRRGVVGARHGCIATNLASADGLGAGRKIRRLAESGRVGSKISHFMG